MVITGTYDLVADPIWRNLVLQEIYLECDTSLAPVTINLFSITDLGRFWNVKIYVTDISNNAGTNPITINAGGTDTINRQGLVNFTVDFNGGDAVFNVVTGNKWSAFSQTILTQTGLTYKGAWNANTNTPTLTSGVGTGGDYYIVSIAGNTNLDGIIDWQVGDWAIFEDATNMWQKIDNHDVQAYNTVENQGNALPQRSIINFTGAGVNAFDNAGKTEVNVTGVSSGNFGLFSQTASSAPITNTTVETSLLDGGVGTLSVPPNGFNVGDSFLAIMTGFLNSANNQQLEIRIRSNGSLLADTGIITLNTATNKDFNLQIYFTIQAIGGAGVASIVTGGNFAYTKNASTTLEGTAFSTRNNTTFDTTVLNTLVITAQWGASNPNNIIYSDIFTLTKTF
jgi:hypothetical protein